MLGLGNKIKRHNVFDLIARYQPCNKCARIIWDDFFLIIISILYSMTQYVPGIT